MPLKARKPAPLVGIGIDITNGAAGVTVSNLTTRTAIPAAGAQAVLFLGLAMGSTNKIVAYNSAGMSPTVSAIATNQVIAAKIEVYSYKVTMPLKSGAANRIMTSSNLLTWYQLALISSTNATYQFLWTNAGGSRFFRTLSP